MATMDTKTPPKASEMRKAKRLQKRTLAQLELVHKLAPELRPRGVKRGGIRGQG